MGLAVSTHFLADMIKNDEEGAGWIRNSIELVNTLLAEAGLPAHVEPTDVRTKMRPHVGSFPYSFLHYLRRAYAHVHEGAELTPLAPGEDPTEDETVEDASSMFDTHLLCHSDSEGYYVPIEFEDVIFDTEKRGLPGEMLGSTQRLMAELLGSAPAIGIEVVNGVLPDEQVEAINNDRESAPFYRERLVWL
ncbi:MAG TPA: hypothetical protein VGC41_26260, partial [Kofleriaceae bacterium]